MNNLAFKYNRFLITVFTFAPFAAYFTLTFLDMDFLRIMQLLTYIGVVLLIIFKKKGRVLKIPGYLIFYLLFIFYDFFSTFYLLNREFKLMYLFSNYLIGGLNLMFIIENIAINKRHFRFVINYSKLILIVAIILILLQQAIDKSIFVKKSDTALYSTIKGVSDNEDRLHSIYSWISMFSNGFGFVPIYLIIIEFIYRKKKKIVLLTLMGIIYAILTKERWVMLNALLVFPIFFLYNKNKLGKLIKLLLIIPLITISIFVLSESIGANMKGIFEDRILESNKKSFNQKAASSRILAFVAFNKFYWDNPIFGKGNIKYGMGGTNKQDYKLRSFLRGRSSQIHVGYLSVFYMYGLIGGFLFLSFLYLLMKKLFNNARKTKMWGPFLGMMGLVLANLTLVTFLVFEMGLIISLYVDKYYIQEYSKLKISND